MKSLFTTLAALLISTHAFAQDIAEPQTEEQSLLRKVPKNLEDRFSFDVHYQGTGSQTGLGVAVETPFAWDFVALRLGLSADRVHNTLANDADFRFYTFQAALKIQGDLESTAQIFPYVLVGYNAFIGTDRSEGSKHALEALIGADWRFVSTPVFQKNVRIVRAFFIEAGMVESDLRAFPISPGVGTPVSDGFMGRIGFRRYF
ncbi:MAG: hypothetical protein EOP05_19590 [Proteobacteria bacterium]|nr:MAG: hypothetical protein EOP05_19590 [Pseudomonadota bacterium]